MNTTLEIEQVLTKATALKRERKHQEALQLYEYALTLCFPVSRGNTFKIEDTNFYGGERKKIMNEIRGIRKTILSR